MTMNEINDWTLSQMIESLAAANDALFYGVTGIVADGDEDRFDEPDPASWTIQHRELLATMLKVGRNTAWVRGLLIDERDRRERDKAHGKHEQRQIEKVVTQ